MVSPHAQYLRISQIYLKLCCDINDTNAAYVDWEITQVGSNCVLLLYY